MIFLILYLIIVNINFLISKRIKELYNVATGNIGTEEAPKFNAWNTNSTLILEHLDTVAQKIYFKLTINKIERGTVTLTDGKPVFTVAE